MTSSPDSFYQLDLGYLLDQYIDVLGALRAPFDAPGVSNPSSGVKASSPVSRISQAAQDGTEVDVDLALSTTPLGPRGSKATYWVHPDHMVEVQVLLLQHMRLLSGTCDPTRENSPEMTPHRRKSSATAEKYFGSEDCIGMLVLDHPESFAIKENASTVGFSEESPGNLQVKAAGNARWTSHDDAVVAVGLEDPSDILTAKLKRKHLAAFLDLSTPPGGWQDSVQDDRDDGEAGGAAQGRIETTRKWLADHTGIIPIAGFCSKRTRFVGLHNSNNGGMWATFDRDILLSDSLHKSLNDEDWPVKARTGAATFPHGVLEVRCEGNHPSTLIQILDRSHLVRPHSEMYKQRS